MEQFIKKVYIIEYSESFILYLDCYICAKYDYIGHNEQFFLLIRSFDKRAQMAKSQQHDQTRDGYHCLQSISDLAPTCVSTLLARSPTQEIESLRNFETDLLAP